MELVSPIIFVAIFVAVLLAISKIVSKAGYSPLWAVVWFVPLVNVVMLFVFAFARWPALEENQRR